MWEAKGYCGGGNVESLIDSLRGLPAVVAGSGRGCFEEVDRACAVFDGRALVFAVNDVGVLLPRVDHFVSLHTAKLDLWTALRRDSYSAGYGNTDFRVHDGGMFGARDYFQWTDLTPTMALSGMFAAQIAYLMGCAPVVLAGCPNDDTPRFWELRSRAPFNYSRMQKSIREEMEYKPEFKKTLRATSGWSREFFGGL